MGVFFAPILWGGQVYYPGDTARVYLPQQSALARSLAHGTLPWWTTDLGAGYPLLAEGQTGALYPPNLLLHVLLPPLLVLTVSIVFHYLLAGAGFYYLSRGFGLSAVASYWGALVFCLGGFGIAHLSHVSVLATLAWSPWMLACTRNLLQATGPKRPWAQGVGLALSCGLQFLAGHPQVSLLGLLARWSTPCGCDAGAWRESAILAASRSVAGRLACGRYSGAASCCPRCN